MDELEKLSEVKRAFVLRDLDMAFNSATRERDWLARLRQWEIVLFAAATPLFLDGKIQSSKFLIALIFIDVIFWVLEARVRAILLMIGNKTKEQERLLETSNRQEFMKAINKWKFGTGQSHEDGRLTKKLISTMKAGLFPGALIWHGLYQGWVAALYLHTII